jgi:hypothetical protein
MQGQQFTDLATCQCFGDVPYRLMLPRQQRYGNAPMNGRVGSPKHFEDSTTPVYDSLQIEVNTQKFLSDIFPLTVVAPTEHFEKQLKQL